MKKVITYGTYDLLHRGHINLLKRPHSLRQLRKFSETQGHEFPQVCTPEEL